MATAIPVERFLICGHEFVGPVEKPEQLPPAPGLLAIIDTLSTGEVTISNLGCVDSFRETAAMYAHKKLPATIIRRGFAFLDGSAHDGPWRWALSLDLIRQLGLG